MTLPSTTRRIDRPVTTRQGYASWAPTYDLFDNPMTALAARVLEERGGRLEGLRVCELGCGTGRNAQYFVDRGAAYVGLDSSPEMLEQARRRWAHAAGVRFVEADVETAWWREHGGYDVVFACLLLEHLPRLEPVLEACAGVANPGARLWLVELHAQRHAEGVRAHVETPSGVLRLPSFAHTAGDYARALAGSGWEVLSTSDIYATAADEERCAKLARYRGQPVLTEVWGTRRRE